MYTYLYVISLNCKGWMLHFKDVFNFTNLCIINYMYFIIYLFRYSFIYMFIYFLFIYHFLNNCFLKLV